MLTTGRTNRPDSHSPLTNNLRNRWENYVRRNKGIILQASKKRVRRSNFERALTAYMRDMLVGRQPKSRVMNYLGFKTTTWKDLTAKLRDPESALAQAAADRGVRLVVEGRGRGSRTYLVKD